MNKHKEKPQHKGEKKKKKGKGMTHSLAKNNHEKN